MIRSIKIIYDEYKSIIRYVFFGVCTTIINVLVYSACYYWFSIPNVHSTIIAWLLSVLFAFVSNKLFVFNSKSIKVKTIIYELFTFFFFRILTGIIDVGIMYITVDKMSMNPTVFKMVSNIIVIILNYIASKLIIFKMKDSQITHLGANIGTRKSSEK